MVERGEISEEMEQAIDEVLLRTKSGDYVKACYYENGQYINLEGRLTKLDLIYKYIMIEEGKIFFSDLYGLEKK